MRKFVEIELEQLRELVDMLEDGLLVVDGLREGDSQPAFRTLVQLDGDVMSSISAAALSDPEFASAHMRHVANVGQQLRAHTVRLRRQARWVSAFVSGGGACLVGFGSYGSGLTLEFVDGMWEMILSGAGGLFVGVVAWPLGGKVLQGVISWRLGHERRGRTNSALDRLRRQLGG
jgi:hypothetical protein